MKTTPAAAPPSSPQHDGGADLIDDPGLPLDQATGNLVFVQTLLCDLALPPLGRLSVVVARLVLRFGNRRDALLAVIHRWTGQEVSLPRPSLSHLVATIAFWPILAFTVSAVASLFRFHGIAALSAGLL